MKAVVTPPYSFNEVYMKRVKKDDFVKAHNHLEIYGIDLVGEWEKHNPGKKKPEVQEGK